MAKASNRGRPQKSERDRGQLVHVRLNQELKDGIARHRAADRLADLSDSLRSLLVIGLKDQGILK